MLVETLLLVALGIKIGSKQLPTVLRIAGRKCCFLSGHLLSLLSFHLPSTGFCELAETFSQKLVLPICLCPNAIQLPRYAPPPPQPTKHDQERKRPPPLISTQCISYADKGKDNSGSWKYPQTVGQNEQGCQVGFQYHPSSISARLHCFTAILSSNQ